MKIVQMRQILEICECGSINKAAEKLYMSQSSLSASVISAENELGTNLFARNRNGITLTPAGERFVEHSRKILAEYDGFLSEIRTEDKPRLSITSQYLRYANTVFAKVSGQLENRDIEFRFLEKGSNEACSNVMNKASDIGIIVTPTVSREKVAKLLHRNNLEGHLVSVDESRCIVGRNSPLYSIPGEYVSAKQLAAYPCLEYERNEWTGDVKLFSEEKSTFPCSRMVTISDTGSFNNMLTHTACFFIGIYNENAYKDNDFYDNLRALKIVDRSFSFDTIWIHRKGWTVNEPAEIYLKELYRTAGKMTYEGAPTL